MIVKIKQDLDFKKIKNFNTKNLSKKASYYVLGQSVTAYRIINEVGEPVLYPIRIFRVIEDGFPTDWVKNIYSKDEIYIDPKPFSKPGFYEDLFDGKKYALKAFYKFVLSCKDLDKDRWLKQCKASHSSFKEVDWKLGIDASLRVH